MGSEFGKSLKLNLNFGFRSSFEDTISVPRVNLIRQCVGLNILYRAFIYELT